FGFEDALDRRADLLVLARDQPRRHLAHGDLRAEAAEHLCELQPDVAAADDRQVLGHAVELEDAAVIERRHAIEAIDRWSRRFSADVEKDLRRAEPTTIDLDGVRI